MKLHIRSLLLVLIMGFSTVAMAHSLFIAANENDDGTVIAEGMYSTGGVASGIEVRLEDVSGRVLWKGEADENGKVTYKRPDVPYMIIFDGGGGHMAMEEGI